MNGSRVTDCSVCTCLSAEMNGSRITDSSCCACLSAEMNGSRVTDCGCCACLSVGPKQWGTADQKFSAIFCAGGKVCSCIIWIYVCAGGEARVRGDN